VLARVAGPQNCPSFYENEHRAQGVDLRLEVQVDCVVGIDGEASPG
jgi:3-phenylpropionate/trans-cinnamate dioxygenase ferredoxin reductase subunit